MEQLTLENTQWPVFLNANSLKIVEKQEQIFDFKYFLVSCHHTIRLIVGMGKFKQGLKDSDELSIFCSKYWIWMLKSPLHKAAVTATFSDHR